MSAELSSRASRPVAGRAGGRSAAFVVVLAIALVTASTAPASTQTAPPANCVQVIDGKLGAGYSGDFVDRWRNRLAGVDTAFSWDDYQGTPDGAPSIVDGVIPRPFFRQIAQQERFAQLVPETDRVCLVHALFTRMQGEGSTTLDHNVVKTLVYSLLFTEGSWTHSSAATSSRPRRCPQCPNRPSSASCCSRSGICSATPSWTSSPPCRACPASTSPTCSCSSSRCPTFPTSSPARFPRCRSGLRGSSSSCLRSTWPSSNG